MTRASLFAKFSTIAFFISSAVETFIRSTPTGLATSVGPLITVTSAPSAEAASASENPILPVDGLEIKRTGSIHSLVGPAETSIFLPFKLPEFRWVRSEWSITRLSANLPTPFVPEASDPYSGSINPKPASLRRFTFCFSMGFSYIPVSIAAAKIVFVPASQMTVERRSSAIPLAALPIIFAVAGDTRTASAHLEISTCLTPTASLSLNILVHTGLPLKVSKINVDMNFSAESVIITCTSAPCSIVSSRKREADLYMAIPPVTPSTIFLFLNFNLLFFCIVRSFFIS